MLGDLPAECRVARDINPVVVVYAGVIDPRKFDGDHALRHLMRLHLRVQNYRPELGDPPERFVRWPVIVVPVLAD